MLHTHLYLQYLLDLKGKTLFSCLQCSVLAAVQIIYIYAPRPSLREVSCDFVNIPLQFLSTF